MRKSLQLQAELGPVFDVTLDGEDGAPVGGEVDHALVMADLVACAANRFNRVGVRLLPVSHPAFESMLGPLVAGAGARLAYLMLPKLESLAELERGVTAIDAACAAAGVTRSLPLHGLIETHGGLRAVQALADHPRVESLSFGLMDFVSAHRGAIPASAMGATGQFSHPLVLRAKLEIAAACHAAGKTPSHSVVTEFTDMSALHDAARRASREFGFTRMWSIHPTQVRVIVDAFTPDRSEIDEAIAIVVLGQDAQWAPIRHRSGGQDRLHDRASYRYYWQLLERAQTASLAGQPLLPREVRERFFEESPT